MTWAQTSVVNRRGTPVASGLLEALASVLAMLCATPGCSPEVRVTWQPTDYASTSDSGGDAAGSGAAGAGGADPCEQGCGEHRWSKRFGDDESFNEDDRESGFEMAVDTDDRVTLVGRFEGTLELGGEPLTTEPYMFDERLFFASFEPDGTHRWSRATLPTTLFGWPIPLSVTHDAAGNIFVAGTFFGELDFGGGPLLSTPVPTWDESGAILPEFADCCAVEYAAFVVKLAPDGGHLWSKRLGRSQVLCEDYCSQPGGPGVLPMTLAVVSVNGAGEVLLSGSFQGDVDFGGGPLQCAGQPTDAESFEKWQDGFLAKLDPDGEHLWSMRAGDVGEDSLTAEFDESGELVVFGKFEQSIDLGGGPLYSAGGTDVLLARLDAEGQHRWSKRFGTVADDWLRGLRVPQSQDVVLLGPAGEPALDLGAGPIGSLGDWFIARLDAQGEPVWTRVIAQPDIHWTQVDAGLGGEILIAGMYAGTLDLGEQQLVAQDTAEFFLAKLAPDGSTRWSQRFDSTLVTEGFGCHVVWCNQLHDAKLDRAGNALITGDFRGAVDFGAGPLQSLGVGDGFIASFGP